MNIFVTHSSAYDYEHELYLPLRNSILNHKYSFFLPKEGRFDEVITIDYIKNSEVVLAEVSYPSTGQGIELGWANTLQVPIICIYKKETKYSAALSKLTNRFYFYADSRDMIKKIEIALLKLK